MIFNNIMYCWCVVHQSIAYSFGLNIYCNSTVWQVSETAVKFSLYTYSSLLFCRNEIALRTIFPLTINKPAQWYPRKATSYPANYKSQKHTIVIWAKESSVSCLPICLVNSINFSGVKLWNSLPEVYKYWTVQNLLYECCFWILVMSYGVLCLFFRGFLILDLRYWNPAFLLCHEVFIIKRKKKKKSGKRTLSIV